MEEIVLDEMYGKEFKVQKIRKKGILPISGSLS